MFAAPLSGHPSATTIDRETRAEAHSIHSCASQNASSAAVSIAWHGMRRRSPFTQVYMFACEGKSFDTLCQTPPSYSRDPPLHRIPATHVHSSHTTRLARAEKQRRRRHISVVLSNVEICVARHNGHRKTSKNNQDVCCGKEQVARHQARMSQKEAPSD